METKKSKPLLQSANQFVRSAFSLFHFILLTLLVKFQSFVEHIFGLYNKAKKSKLEFLSLLYGLSNTWYVSPDLGSRRPSPGSHDPAGHQGVDHDDHDDGEEDVVEEAAGYQEVHHDDGEEEDVAAQPATSPPLPPPGHRRWISATRRSSYTSPSPLPITPEEVLPCVELLFATRLNPPFLRSSPHFNWMLDRGGLKMPFLWLSIQM